MSASLDNVQVVLRARTSISPDVKAVRDFILLWRSKQTFIKGELTSKDALAFKLYWTKS